ncbi:hypothetical protein SAMN04488126_10585 [Bhargavaea beijingensis]|uniref:Uncharacterized protein n=2 Tax=Bhargavaea beijingensis TaxID=426756 RepID=A0A1G7B6U1_9BACL|nr:hypothetical protein SAMN04488126_10585 [Bhargavaea beijingensis]
MLRGMGKLTKLAGAAGLVAGAAYLTKEENRKKVKNRIDEAIRVFNPDYKKELGKPADIDDAEMVSEGAMTSVQYYNQYQEDKSQQ